MIENHFNRLIEAKKITAADHFRLTVERLQRQALADPLNHSQNLTALCRFERFDDELQYCHIAVTNCDVGGHGSTAQELPGWIKVATLDNATPELAYEFALRYPLYFSSKRYEFGNADISEKIDTGGRSEFVMSAPKHLWNTADHYRELIADAVEHDLLPLKNIGSVFYSHVQIVPCGNDRREAAA